MKNGKLISEEVSRIKSMMGLNEQPSNPFANLPKEIVQGLMTNLIKGQLGIEDDEVTNIFEPTSGTTNLDYKSKDDEFYKEVLKGIGAPITDENMKFMYAWRQAEGGSAKNNPFNTTLSKAHSTFYNCLKKGIMGCQSGVRNYMSRQDGIDATIKTLKNGRYQNIINSLKNGGDAVRTAEALKSSPWGTGQLALKVLRGYNAGAKPKPPVIA